MVYKIGKGLPLLCIESIEKCDMDIIESLLNNIILTGRTSKIENLEWRLRYDIIDNLNSSIKDKVHFRFIGDYDGIVTRNNYNEYGNSIIHQYFF